MNKLVKNTLKKFIEKHYDTWGTEIITKLPAEFVITEHAYQRMKKRFSCKEEKMHKIVVKAWKHSENLDNRFIYKAKQINGPGIYKTFNGFVFVFRIRRHHNLGVPQKYLVTVFKQKGYQYSG